MDIQRNEASLCMGKKAPYVCNTTLFALQGQKSKKDVNPGISIPVKRMKEWLDIWAILDNQTAKRCEGAWNQIVCETEPQRQSQKWRHNQGAISVAMINLQDLDIQPKKAGEWATRDGQILEPSR